MRLDDFDPNSVNIGDQRGGGFSIGGTGGRVGCGSLVIALIAALVFGVDPTSMHVTLAFLGEQPESALPRLEHIGASAAATVPAAHLRLGEAGSFGPRGAPRVLWVTQHPTSHAPSRVGI